MHHLSTSVQKRNNHVPALSIGPVLMGLGSCGHGAVLVKLCPGARAPGGPKAG